MLVFDFLDQRDAFLKDMSDWIKSGAIVWEETITDGLENAPSAFIGLFKGDNMGKSLVRLAWHSLVETRKRLPNGLFYLVPTEPESAGDATSPPSFSQRSTARCLSKVADSVGASEEL